MNKPFSTLVAPALALPRLANRALALLVDLSLCVLTVWFACYLRLGEFVTLSGKAFGAVETSVIVS
jgi:hypothetical protein